MYFILGCILGCKYTKTSVLRIAEVFSVNLLTYYIVFFLVIKLMPNKIHTIPKM